MNENHLIKIDKSWMEKELISHLTEKIGDKISMRVYTVKPHLLKWIFYH